MASDGSPELAPSHVDDDQIPSSEDDENFDALSSGAEAADGTPSSGHNGAATGSAPDGDDDAQEAGMLPRDKQRRTAFYDYASEKQMSHSEARQFYQRHQLESHHGGSQQGDSFSPVMRARTFPAHFGAAGETVDMQASVGSIRSRKSNVSLANLGPRSTQAEQSQQPQPTNGAPADPLLEADQLAREHALHPSLPHEHKPLLENEGIHGAGAGVGIGSGAGGFAMSDSEVTAELSSIYTNVQRVLDLRHK